MGKYDNTTSKIVSDIFYYLKQSIKYKRNKKYILNYNNKIKCMVELSINRNIDITNYIIDIGINPLNINSIILNLYINPTNEQIYYNSLFYDLHGDIIHEIEHLTQQGVNRKKGKPRRSKVGDTTYSEFISKDEIPAYTKGFYHKAKKMRRDMKFLIDEYLNSFIQNKEITENQKIKIIKKWNL